MQLKELAGEHLLRWIKMGARNPIDKDAECVIFQLDNNAYMVMEDPDDGYRSSARDVVVLGTGIYDIDGECPISVNERVVVVHHEKGRHEWDDVADILEFVSASTGKVVLTIGTDDLNDYYPCFLAEWAPQNLSANADKP